VLMLKPLTEAEIEIILKNAVFDRERGLGNYDIKISDGALKFLAMASGGDARIALNALELAAMTSEMDSGGSIFIDEKTAEDCIQRKPVVFDKTGDSHYDNISAFIKSMRGSDPDAAVFYLARAIYAGEDPEFLARRIIICASEDVGMANPSALQTAVAAAEAAKIVGMPEARIILAHAAIMVATSPKSNSCYMAIEKALHDVETKRTGEVPMHLRNPSAPGMSSLGCGKGYKYAHDYPGSIVKQQFLPSEIAGAIYYKPSSNGYEAKIKEWLERIRCANDANS
ncbi:MAG: replication-associated recombination protein A, partial [Oscillospiraceae bacterium]|nr:replication-associated recombination protein A [Oscillospiraceae bacterium]